MGGTEKRRNFPCRHSRFCIVGFIALFGVLPSEGGAEDVVPTLDPVTVTARKIREAPETVPQQMTVLTEDDIANSGIDGPRGISFVTPSLELGDVDHAVETPLFMRGVGTYGNGEPSVGYFVDGVYLAPDSYLAQELLDVERIEVLKGPQSTLYGKNTVGGVIHVITKDPSFEPEGHGSYSYGEGGRHRAKAGVSGPLSGDGPAVRVSAFKEVFPGIEKASNGQPIDHDRQTVARITLLGDDGEALEIRPAFSVGRRRQGVFRYKKVRDDRDYEGKPYGRSDPTTGDIGTLNASLRLVYEGDDHTFTSLTGWNRNDETYSVDLDLSAADNFFLTRDVERTDFSQELRLAHDGGGPVTWLASLYFYHITDDFESLVYNGGEGGTLASTTSSTTKGSTYSAFANADWRITPDLTLGGGLRFDWDLRKKTAPDGNGRRTYASISPKVTLSYQVVPEAMVYGSFAIGNKAGGFNDGPYPPFDEETVTTYEAGFKTRWADRFTLNGAAFLTYLEDQQTSEVDLSRVAEFTSNRGNARSYGFEMEAGARVTPEFRIAGGMSMINAFYTDYEAVRTGPEGTKLYDFKGKRLPVVPLYELKLQGDYERPVGTLHGNDVTAFAHVEMKASGKRQWRDFNAATAEPYQIVNLSFGVEAAGVRVRGYVDNVFDRGYFGNYAPAFAFPLAGGSNFGILGERRRLGIEVTAEF